MSKSLFLILFCILMGLSVIGQSPFGFGKIDNQNIGQIENEEVILPSESGYGFFNFFPDAQQLLQNHNFDIYVPDHYDESEPFGLVVFINSGDNGGFKNQWLPVLEERNLIWIAGDGTGNSININIRMGLAMAGVLRMLELYHIDRDRIYTSGNSGGARMAHNLAFIYPEMFRGALPSCGGSYIRKVAQDYETQNPDGHYEAILNYPSDYLDYLLPFEQRFANMTSYADFREGDIMNIYHNGSEVDGLRGKFLETSGGHCSTTTEHFLDALNFVEHPLHEIIDEDFDGATPISFKLLNADLANGQQLEMSHNLDGMAQAQSIDLFNWHDPMGAIFETSIQCNPVDFNNNTRFHIGIWSMQEPMVYCGFLGNELKGELPAILITLDFSQLQPLLKVQVLNPNRTEFDVLFLSYFSDWDVNDALKIKYHLWDQEWRIEFGVHLEFPSVSIDGVRLLDDMRSIRVRWNEITPDFWEDSLWSSGAFLTLFSERLNIDLSTSPILIDRVELMAADIEIETEIPHSNGMFLASFCEGDTLVINNETITEEAFYQLVLTNAMGCDSFLIVSTTFYPLPEVTIVKMDGELIANEGFDSYQWYLNGELISGANESSIAILEEGDYYVEVEDENGCQNDSNTLNVMITSTGDELANGISIYPNPTSLEINIDTKGKSFEASLYDVMGNRVIDSLKSENDLSQLSNGIYLVVLRSAEEVIVKKVEKVD